MKIELMQNSFFLPAMPLTSRQGKSAIWKFSFFNTFWLVRGKNLCDGEEE
jgi:hypothetical protein